MAATRAKPKASDPDPLAWVPQSTLKQLIPTSYSIKIRRWVKDGLIRTQTNAGGSAVRYALADILAMREQQTGRD